MNKLDLDQEGYIKTKNQILPAYQAFFAWEMYSKTYRQAVTAAGFGCGSIKAEKFLTSIEN